MDLQDIIDRSQHIVFFGGAGVSTASGIPDFRSRSGIGRKKAEEILSRSFFEDNTEDFFDFYKKHLLFPNAQPNTAHYVLAALEKKGKLKAVITQNVDGLHRKAGSNIVYELHGNVNYNYCTECGKMYGVDHILNSNGIPRCECGGIVKPDVVLYGEPLNEYMLRMANAFVMASQTFIIGGTSLNVYPAAELVDSYMHSQLIVINETPTVFDNKADIVIHDRIENVLEKIKI